MPNLQRDQHYNSIYNLGNRILHNKKTVTAAGTAVLLIGATQETLIVTIKALHTNTNMIYVGDFDVDSNNGYVLDAGEEVTLIVDNAQDNIYIDSDTNGEGVTYIAWYAA